MSGVGNAPATMVLCIKSPAQQIDSINWWRPVVHWWNGVNIKSDYPVSIMTQMMTQALSYRCHDEQYLIRQHWFFIVMNIIIIRILQKHNLKKSVCNKVWKSHYQNGCFSFVFQNDNRLWLLGGFLAFGWFFSAEGN